MKIKTSELTGAALDGAVAKVLGTPHILAVTNHGEPIPPTVVLLGTTSYMNKAVSYSTNWAQGGPIIEREGLHLRKSGCEWQCDYWSESALNFDTSYGPTPLIAAMRCFVASRLGEEVEVPDELS